MTTDSFSLVFQNEYFVIVNKSANCNFHDEESLGQGLFNQVKKQLNLPTLFPVHRLDKMTSGLVMLAKTHTVASELGKQFQQHQIEKFYIALSKNKPKKKQGWIIGDMEKSRRSAYKLLRSQTNPAITQFFSFSLIPNLRLYLVKPLSGKTHQIRVALKSIGADIAGDPIYNVNDIADRGYLHAYALRFTLFEDEYQFIEKPNTGDLFAIPQLPEALARIGRPWQLKWPK